MKIGSNLQLMRNEWYNAFYSLDIAQLDYLEADWFFSTNGEKMIYKKHQLRKLTLLKRDDPAVFQHTRREEYDVVTRELGGIASVSGIAVVSSPDEQIQISFIECWIKLKGSWKLQFQSYESFES
ncbi:nuclear transport factor 2 family protein [Kosakonia sacchari]|uniref:nuclear transport factor 2 family protein n=1 Tax=Kosakonia sacchari TaxID=1158459 RepID=UPI0032D9A4C4